MLKNCPFCGGEADLWYKGVKYGRITFAECAVCGAKTKAFSYNSREEDYDDTDIGAIRATDAWNRRFKDG